MSLSVHCWKTRSEGESKSRSSLSYSPETHLLRQLPQKVAAAEDKHNLLRVPVINCSHQFLYFRVSSVVFYESK